MKLHVSSFILASAITGAQAQVTDPNPIPNPIEGMNLCRWNVPFIDLSQPIPTPLCSDYNNAFVWYTGNQPNVGIPPCRLACGSGTPFVTPEELESGLAEAPVEHRLLITIVDDPDCQFAVQIINGFLDPRTVSMCVQWEDTPNQFQLFPTMQSERIVVDWFARDDFAFITGPGTRFAKEDSCERRDFDNGSTTWTCILNGRGNPTFNECEGECDEECQLANGDPVPKGPLDCQGFSEE